MVQSRRIEVILGQREELKALVLAGESFERAAQAGEGLSGGPLWGWAVVLLLGAATSVTDSLGTEYVFIVFYCCVGNFCDDFFFGGWMLVLWLICIALVDAPEDAGWEVLSTSSRKRSSESVAKLLMSWSCFLDGHIVFQDFRLQIVYCDIRWH